MQGKKGGGWELWSIECTQNVEVGVGKNLEAFAMPVSITHSFVWVLVCVYVYTHIYIQHKQAHIKFKSHLLSVLLHKVQYYICLF